MNRLRPLLLAGLALVFLAGGATCAFRCRRDAALLSAARQGDVSAWFRVEFGLDEPTIAALRRAQEEFVPQCEEHCRDIRAARRARHDLPAAAPEAERTAADRRVTDAEQHCDRERLAHAKRLAALMPPAAAHRYLDIVLPRLRHLDHTGAPDAAGRP